MIGFKDVCLACAFIRSVAVVRFKGAIKRPLKCTKPALRGRLRGGRQLSYFGRIGGSQWRMRVDRRPHAGLREAGFVEFVVAVAAVTDQIDDNITTGPVSPCDCRTGDRGSGDGVVAIDMKNRNAEGFSYICWILRRAAFLRGGREADLVVDHQVYGASDLVTFQSAELKEFTDQPLAGKCCIC